MTDHSAYTRSTNVGYYTRPYNGDGFYTAPISEIVSSEGYLVSNNPLPEATLRLRAAIKNQNLNLAQSCAEYRQVAGMFSSFARDFASTYRAIRGGLPSLFSAAFGRLLSRRDPRALRAANRWLQYQYGLRPLMSDMYGVMDLLVGQLQSGYLTKTRVSGRCSLNGERRFDSLTTQVQTGSQKYTAVAYFTVTLGQLKSLAQNGITNPALLVWEFIPYSFVLDWIIPVGGFLSSLDALTGVDLHSAYVSWTDDFTVEASYRGYTSKSESIYKYRRVISLSMPAYLSYKPSESWEVLVNGTALLTQIRYR